jgi:hypothetical protein
MWWNGQNLDKPIYDKKGRAWHFRVWHDFIEGVYIQRIYFWNDEKSEMRMLEFQGNKTLNVKQIKTRMRKLAINGEYRRKCQKILSFPIERHY